MGKLRTNHDETPWFIDDPQAVEEVREQLKQFPTLHLTFRDNAAAVIGTFPLTHDGQVFDRYSLELQLASDHPYSPPSVFEVAGRIPRVIDRHILKDEALCLGVYEQLWPEPGQKIDLSKYLNTHVRNYLLGNTLFELGQPWPFGERSHGVSGILQYYAETYGVTNASMVQSLLNYALDPNTKGHWDCFCGSKRKMRNCHPKLVVELRRTKHPKVLRFSLDMINKALQSVQSKASIQSKP